MAKEITIMQEGSNEETFNLLSIEDDEALIGLEKENEEKETIIIQEVSNEETLNLLSEGESEALIDLDKEGSGGTSDYEALLNKPKINGVELTGNKTSEELKIQAEINSISDETIEEIVNINIVNANEVYY